MEPSPLLLLSFPRFWMDTNMELLLVFRTLRSSCGVWWISFMKNWRNQLLQRQGIWIPVTRTTSETVTEVLRRMSSSPVTQAVTGVKEMVKVGPQGVWAAAPSQRRSCWSRMKQGEGSPRKRGWRTESSPVAIGAATRSRWMRMQMLILPWCQLMVEPHLRCCQLPVLPAHVGHQVSTYSSSVICEKTRCHPTQGQCCIAVAKNTQCECSFYGFQEILPSSFSSVSLAVVLPLCTIASVRKCNTWAREVLSQANVLWSRVKTTSWRQW